MQLNVRIGSALVALAAAALLCSCGLADTAVSSAAGAASEAQEARQAKQIEQNVQNQVQAAQQQASAQVDQAEKDSQ